MKKLEPVMPIDSEEEVENFKALVPSLVKEGYITRTPDAPGEFGTGLDGVKSNLRPIAEQDLSKQGK